MAPAARRRDRVIGEQPIEFGGVEEIDIDDDPFPGRDGRLAPGCVPTRWYDQHDNLLARLRPLERRARNAALRNASGEAQTHRPGPQRSSGPTDART